MLQRIALVSESSRVSIGDVALVAAAIQKQVTRDLAPIWNVNATVSAFASLDEIPLGHWPLILRDDIASDEDGIHRLDNNHQPMALVRASTNWSLTASHECLEMLVDPSGNRLVTSNSVKPEQGRVQYLVEVCDPCEGAAFGYSVDGVLVSDFYTPHYFDPLGSSGVRYSFTGALHGPREVLDGGYLSWLFPPTRQLWQLHVEDGRRHLSNLGASPLALGNFRSFTDRAIGPVRRRALSGPHRPHLLLRDQGGTHAEGASFEDAQLAAARELRSEIELRLTRDVAVADANTFGTFEGLVNTQWLTDGRKMILLDPFVFYESQSNKTWSAPRGSLVDGASIPAIFWGPTIGGPFEGQFRDASVLHDYECCIKRRPWHEVHRMFYSAARARGEHAWRAKLMYFAIYVFGPKWGISPVATLAGDALPPPPESYSAADLLSIATHIRSHPEISLEEIESLTPDKARALAASGAAGMADEEIHINLAAGHRAMREGPCTQQPESRHA